MATRAEIAGMIGWGWDNDGSYHRMLALDPNGGMYDTYTLWSRLFGYYGAMAGYEHKPATTLSCLNNLKRIRDAVGTLSTYDGVDLSFYLYLGELIDKEERNQDNGLQGAKSP